jgi:hypothetical protein
MLFSTLQRSHRSLPKENNIQININLKYGHTKFRRRNRKEKGYSRSRSKSKGEKIKSLNKENYIENIDESYLINENEYFNYIQQMPIININICNSNNVTTSNASFNNDNDDSFDYENCREASKLMTYSMFQNENENKSYTNSRRSSDCSQSGSIMSNSPSSSNKKGYFSICSHKFNSFHYENENIRNFEDSERINHQVTNLNKNCFLQNQLTYLVFYFEIDYLMIWVKDYLKSLYPELNFILLVEVDDDKATSEKIYLNKTIENFKYLPMLKKEDFNREKTSKRNYRFMKVIKNNTEKTIHKISLTLCTYSKGQLIPISYENIFINNKNDYQMSKFKLYKNMNMKYNNKKVANILFSFIFKNKFSNLDKKEDHDMLKSKFSNIEYFSMLENDGCLEFDFYRIRNSYLPIYNEETNDNRCNSFNNLFSINDIHDIEISGELKGDKINYERLLEFVLLVKKKYDFYQILIKLNECSTRQDFSENKKFSFKENLIKRLSNIVEDSRKNQDTTKHDLDKVLIPQIFLILKNIFIKQNKFGINRYKKINRIMKVKKIEDEVITLNLNDEENELSFNYEENFKFINDNENLENFYKMKNFNLLLKSFLISIEILDMHNEVDVEVTISCLNYINRVLEQNFEIDFIIDQDIKINHEKIKFENYRNSEELFIDIIIIENSDVKIWEILTQDVKNEGILLPITQIFSKILKKIPGYLEKALLNKKFNIYGVIKEIIYSINYNSLILTNTIFILINSLQIHNKDDILDLIEYSKLREIFLNFTMNNFDAIHESIIYLLKALLSKKNIMLIESDLVEIFSIFSFGLILIRNKIIQMDLAKLCKIFFNLISLIYIIINQISLMLNKSNKAQYICLEKKIPELLIEVLYSIIEKNILGCLDKFYDRLDVVLLNTKSLIFRSLFHSINLIKNLKFPTEDRRNPLVRK